MEQCFKNSSAALTYLQGQGFNLKKSKLYQDVASGKLRKLPDGRLTLADVSDYADRCLRISPPDFADAKALTLEEKRHQVELLKARRRKLDFEHALAAGKFIERDAAILEFCVKIGIFEAYLKTMARTNAEVWAQLVDGDVERAGELYRAIETGIDSALDEMGDMPEIKVKIRRNMEALN